MPIIIDLIQGSPEWVSEKIGKPSASNASKIITNEGVKSKQSEGYLYELVAERLTGCKEEGYKNENMAVGIEREEESRRFFELIHGVEVDRCGVVYKDDDKRFLCSPDGIINNEYGLELKNPLPKTQVKYLLDNKTPEVYFSQIQMSLYITDFKYWMFMAYVPLLKPLIIRVERDEVFIKKLEAELNKFSDELDRITEKLR